MTPAKFVPGKKHSGGVTPSVVYSFPVGLGRFDWKTPVGDFTVRGKTRNPTWVVPEDIYEEHLERDGEAEHVVSGDDPDNPLGHYRIELTLPEYALHGTNVPWGVGMEVSHGCIRLYPEDIERLFNKVKIGTPGMFVYQPVKFGWRGDSLYVEVHDDLYGKYAGLWAYAQKEAERQGLIDQIDMQKLEKAVEAEDRRPDLRDARAQPPAAPASSRIRRASKEAHHVRISRISNRCRSTRGDHASASRPTFGVPPRSRQRTRLLGNVSRRTCRAGGEPRAASARASDPNRIAFLQFERRS